jgi:hypothetical protein
MRTPRRKVDHKFLVHTKDNVHAALDQQCDMGIGTEEQVLKQLNKICDALYAQEIRDLSDLWLKVRGALKDLDYSKLKPIVLEAALLDKTRAENPECDLFIVKKFEEIGQRCADQLLGQLGPEIRLRDGGSALWTKLGESLANMAIFWQTDLAFKHEVDKLKTEVESRRRERGKAKSKKQRK